MWTLWTYFIDVKPSILGINGNPGYIRSNTLLPAVNLHLHMYTYTDMYTHVHKKLSTYMHVHIHTNAHKCTHHTHTHTRTHIATNSTAHHVSSLQREHLWHFHSWMRHRSQHRSSPSSHLCPPQLSPLPVSNEKQRESIVKTNPIVN